MFKKNTSALLQQELHAPLVFLLLLREPSVRVELRAVQGVFQPLHQLLLLVQLHLQLGQGELQLAFLLAQRHHLRSPHDISITLRGLHISNAAASANVMWTGSGGALSQTLSKYLHSRALVSEADR